MNNAQSPKAKLPDYFINDANVFYEINSKTVFQKITVMASVLNFLNKKYVSNGYMWGNEPYYYPQAKINFLAGVTFFF